jgi:hypothetical protein
MEPVHNLLVEAVACFETVLALLCADAFTVASSVSQNGAQFSIALVGSVTARDEASMKDRDDDVALQHLADSIGISSGVAEVSFQLE